MSSSGRIVVGRADVNTTGSVWSDWHTVIFTFHHFTLLKDKKYGESCRTPPLRCHGYLWSLSVYPSGMKKPDRNTPGYMSVFLRRICEGSDNTTTVRAECKVRVPGTPEKCHRIEHTFTSEESNRGWEDFARVRDVRYGNSYVVDGALTFEVDIRVRQSNPISVGLLEVAKEWTPSTTLSKDMLRLLDSGRLSDIQFKLGDEIIQAHKSIISSRAPTLAELVEDVPSGTAFVVDGVEPSVFRVLLRFVYGEEMPPGNFVKENAYELLRVANRFGCAQLKMISEAELVRSGISVKTAADLILLADAQSCALLKEVATDFFVAHSVAVMETKGWDRLKDSADLLSELMGALVNKDVRNTADSPNADMDRMRVATLRRKLDDLGMDVDGSKEILVKRLKSSHS